jgi:hypothetical protein
VLVVAGQFIAGNNQMKRMDIESDGGGRKLRDDVL